MKTKLLFVALLSALGMSAQVGVGTSTPNAQFDVRATSQATPANTDGLLIPKVDAFAAINPTAAQQGMLVYLTTVVGAKTPGFYYWDFPTLSWIGITSSISSDKDWLETATALAPDDINDDMYHMGRTAIGKISPSAPLDVVGANGTNATINNTASYGDNLGGERMGILNTVNGSTTDTTSGIRQFISGSGTGARAGVYQELGGSTLGQQNGVMSIFSNTGDGLHNGIFNVLSGSGNGVHTGVFSTLGSGGNGAQYGMRNTVSNTGSGAHYGIYNDMSGGTGLLYGTFNVMSGASNTDISGTSNTITSAGTGIHYGVNNIIAGTANGTQYGVYSNISNTGSGSHFGTYSFLNGAGTGTQFGSYALVNNTGTADLYGNFAQVIGGSTGTHFGTYNDIITTATAPGYGTFNTIRNSTSSSNQVATYNSISGTGSGFQYGNYTAITNSGNGEHYGSMIILSGLGNGTHFGTRNDVNGTGTNYGSFNLISSVGNSTQAGSYNTISGTGTGQKIGTYNYIDPTAGGTHYGVASYALKAGSYAGYFQGNVAIGTNAGNPYILPPSRGLNNQIMQTDGAGNVTWKDPATALSPTCWLTTGNSGLTAGTNFLGTTDAQALVFKVNNNERMRINPTDGEIIAGATASPYAGDLLSAQSTATLPFAVNGYCGAAGGAGTWGEILASSNTSFSGVQGVYGGTGGGAGVLGNYAGTNTGALRAGVVGVVQSPVTASGGTGVYGANNMTSGNQRMGVYGSYNGSAYGLAVTGVAFGGGIPTGNQDIAVVGWRANNANYSGYFNGNHVIANGTKSASVGTSKGNQLLYVTETPGVWFEDIGRGQLVNGTVEIKLDPLFLETVAIDDQHPMSVFLQEEGDSNGLYVVPGKDGFVVKEKNGGHSNIAFSYRIMAKRLHFQDHRFGNDPVWGEGDTRKFNQDAPPPPIDYNENVRFQEAQKRNYQPTPMPQGFVDYFTLQREAADIKTAKDKK